MFNQNPLKLEIKEVQPVKVYYKSIETTLIELNKYVKNTPGEMYEDLAKYGIEPAGDQIWIYKGGDGNPETKFTLEIAIPVNRLLEIDNMQFKELETFPCISITHEGSWENLKVSYQKVMQEMKDAGKQPGRECREVYVNCDFENPANNITEVQVGIL